MEKPKLDAENYNYKSRSASPRSMLTWRTRINQHSVRCPCKDEPVSAGTARTLHWLQSGPPRPHFWKGTGVSQSAPASVLNLTCPQWALIPRRFVSRSHGRLARIWRRCLAAGSCGLYLKPPAVLQQQHIVLELYRRCKQCVGSKKRKGIEQKINSIWLLGVSLTSTCSAHHEEHNQPTSAVPCMNQALWIRVTLVQKKECVSLLAASRNSKAKLGHHPVLQKQKTNVPIDLWFQSGINNYQSTIVGRAVPQAHR